MEVIPVSEELNELLQLWEDSGPRERKALLLIAKRLYAGQKTFGELTRGKKNWVKEASEEAMDMCVYLAAELLDIDDDRSTPNEVSK